MHFRHSTAHIMKISLGKPQKKILGMFALPNEAQKVPFQPQFRQNTTNNEHLTGPIRTGARVDSTPLRFFALYSKNLLTTHT